MLLTAAGHDAVHVRERGLQRATDEMLLDLAALEERAVASADTDFGMLACAGRDHRTLVPAATPAR